MIEAHGLVKRYGSTVAVVADNCSVIGRCSFRDEDVAVAARIGYLSGPRGSSGPCH